MDYFVPHNEFNLLSPIHETNCKRFAIEKWPQNLIVFLKLFDIWFHFETKTLECYILSTTLQFYVNHGLICSAQRVQPFISYPWSKLQTFCHRKVTSKFNCFLEVVWHKMPFWDSKLWNARSCQPLCCFM